MSKRKKGPVNPSRSQRKRVAIDRDQGQQGHDDGAPLSSIDFHPPSYNNPDNVRIIPSSAFTPNDLHVNDQHLLSEMRVFEPGARAVDPEVADEATNVDFIKVLSKRSASDCEFWSRNKTPLANYNAGTHVLDRWKQTEPLRNMALDSHVSDASIQERIRAGIRPRRPITKRATKPSALAQSQRILAQSLIQDVDNDETPTIDELHLVGAYNQVLLTRTTGETSAILPPPPKPTTVAGQSALRHVIANKSYLLCKEKHKNNPEQDLNFNIQDKPATDSSAEKRWQYLETVLPSDGEESELSDNEEAQELFPEAPNETLTGLVALDIICSPQLINALTPKNVNSMDMVSASSGSYDMVVANYVLAYEQREHACFREISEDPGNLTKIERLLKTYLQLVYDLSNSLREWWAANPYGSSANDSVSSQQGDLFRQVVRMFGVSGQSAKLQVAAMQKHWSNLLHQNTLVMTKGRQLRDRLETWKTDPRFVAHAQNFTSWLSDLDIGERSIQTLTRTIDTLFSSFLGCVKAAQSMGLYTSASHENSQDLVHSVAQMVNTGLENNLARNMRDAKRSKQRDLIVSVVREQLLDFVEENNYLKTRYGSVYYPVKISTVFGNEFTYFYQQRDGAEEGKIETMVSEACHYDRCPKLYSSITSEGGQVRNEVIRQLKDIVTDRFPVGKADRGLFSSRSGLYSSMIRRGVSWGELKVHALADILLPRRAEQYYRRHLTRIHPAKVPEYNTYMDELRSMYRSRMLMASNFFSMDFDYSEISIAKSMSGGVHYVMPLIAFFRLLHSQKFNENQERNHMTLAARQIRPLLEDRWTGLFNIFGASGVGKSVFSKFIANSFASMHQGIISDTFERQFGWKVLLGKFIIFAPDLLCPSLDWRIVLKAITRDKVSFPVKFGDAVAALFDSHMFMVSNPPLTTANTREKEDRKEGNTEGEMSRRFIYSFWYNSIVGNADLGLESKLTGERLVFFEACLGQYRQDLARHFDKDITTFLDYFFTLVKRYVEARGNSLVAFAMSKRVNLHHQLGDRLVRMFDQFHTMRGPDENFDISDEALVDIIGSDDVQPTSFQCPASTFLAEYKDFCDVQKKQFISDEMQQKRILDTLGIKKRSWSGFFPPHSGKEWKNEPFFFGCSLTSTDQATSTVRASAGKT